MVTVTLRLAASALMASIWALLPSARATQVRLCCGSRRSASSNASPMTAAMSSVTEAVSHLPAAFGPGSLFFFLSLPGAAMTSAGVRGTGVQS